MSRLSKSFYPKLAVSNINKNKQIYYPYILTCIFTVMMYYVMSSIINNSNMSKIKSFENLKMLLGVALFVAIIFSVIFLFYTNSFLMKRRKKEIGLYNILGMEKRHIGKVISYETIIIAVISLTLGIGVGILFSKLMFLFLLKLISFDVVLGFDVPVKSVISTLILFCAIFFVTLVYNLAKIHLSKPIELLHGGEIGEKEPKTKVILTIIGLACIGSGYGFALTVKSPLSAMSLFFVAVILVVIGTYALFTAGSIAVLKILRKNKKYYYQTKHFTSVSGMLYRMKQNAVGLANICILSTMVLIMFSTTVALYLGMEDTLKYQYPKNVSITAMSGIDEKTNEVNAEIDNQIKQAGVEIDNYTAFHDVSLTCRLDHNQFKLEKDSLSSLSMSDIKMCTIIPLDEFNQINHTNYTLKDNEVIMYSKEKLSGISDFKIGNDTTERTFKITERLNKISNVMTTYYEKMVDCYTIIVKDQDTLESIYSMVPAELQKNTDINYSIQFDTKCDKQACIALSDRINKNVIIDDVNVQADNIYEARVEYFGMYGGFLFIGLFLSILFLMATVLIIYYKQISEGYEDKTRFEIMQKVGMSHSEVKKTIRSQVLSVFFLPLIVTGIHIAVSFRIIQKMLLLLGLANTGLFIACTIGAMLLFCAVYGIVFSITARSYYKIVSSKEKK